MDAKVQYLIDGQRAAFGEPFAGSTSDVWSLSSCRDSFGCFRVSLVLDGDMVAEMTKDESYKGSLIDMEPVLEFARFPESRHTGSVLARWKLEIV